MPASDAVHGIARRGPSLLSLQMTRRHGWPVGRGGRLLRRSGVVAAAASQFGAADGCESLRPSLVRWWHMEVDEGEPWSGVQCGMVTPAAPASLSPSILLSTVRRTAVKAAIGACRERLQSRREASVGCSGVAGLDRMRCSCRQLDPFADY